MSLLLGHTVWLELACKHFIFSKVSYLHIVLQGVRQTEKNNVIEWLTELLIEKHFNRGFNSYKRDIFWFDLNIFSP